MAGRFNRILIALSLPIVAIVSFYWLRKRRKGVISSDQAFDVSSVVDSDCYEFSSVSVQLSLIEENEQTITKMQLRELSASDVYSNEANSSDAKETQKVSEKNKLNSQPVNFVNGNNETMENSKETMNYIVDGSKSKRSHSNISECCVIDSSQIKNIDDQCHADFNSGIVINNHKCTRISNKKEEDEEQYSGSENKTVIATNSACGATINCDVNYNNEAFDNKNSDLLTISTEVKNEEVVNTQDLQLNALKESLDNCHIKDESVGCASSDSGLPLTNFSDNHSEGSSDSGNAGSDIHGCASEENSSTSDSVIIYQFEIPQELCGRLIGKGGHYVTLIKNESNARVIINRHPHSPSVKICSIEGLRSEIRQALYLIRKRFPVHEYPEVTLVQINVISPLPYPVPVPQSCQLHLPEGVSCDVIMWSMVNAGHIFLQQPTHPTYPSLSRLDQFMKATYSAMSTPTLPNPTPGVICAASVAGGWFRAMVVDVINNDMCEVKFVDYGGYARMPSSSLRQIRFDFMTLPFQATECYLGSVEPIDENGWTMEANTVFEELAQGQFLQASIVGYADNGIPFVHLHRIQGASSIFINQELVDRRFAQWTDESSYN